MKVIRALQTIYIPKSPELDNEDFIMLTQVDQGELALVADSYLDKLREDSFKIFANVNQKFKRDKSGKKADEDDGDLGD